MSGLGRGASRIQRGGRRPTKPKNSTDRSQNTAESSITRKSYKQTESINNFKFKEPEKNKIKFGFESEKEVKELAPMEKHELSPGSFIQYIPHFYSDEEEYIIFRKLMRKLPFKQHDNLFDSKVFQEPRLSCWFGEHAYGYNPLLRHDATDISEWPEVLQSILSKIKCDPNLMELFPQLDINSVLCNLYRTDKDKMGWHSDNEAELGSMPTIISLSFGDKRRFQLKRIEHDEPEYQITLFPGSLLIMSGSIQSEWHHRVPSEYHDRDERINLTFRKVYPS